MRPWSGDNVLASDAYFAQDMALASDRLLARIERERGASVPSWRLSLSPIDPWRDRMPCEASANAKRMAYSLELQTAECNRVEALRVADRQPCGFCGVRADIGCKRRRQS